MFHFDHIHLVCEDVKAVDAFLRNTIGVQEDPTSLAPNWKYKMDSVSIFVRQRREGEVLLDGSVRRAGADHLAFVVTDIQAAVDHLVAAGCVITEGPTRVRETLSTAFLSCPGGLLLELLQRG